jgi:CPA1 family monovalent cation:H+ antiporter
VLTFNQQYLIASIVMIPLILLTRFLCVGLPVAVLKKFRTFSPHVIKILTWGGLRGGISVALALSLPPGKHRDIILTVTYATVVFSIIVQGLTIGKLVRKSQSSG